MNRCLSERGLLQVHSRAGTAAQRDHLRLCADCAERYDRLVDDLEVLHHVLETPPLAVTVRHAFRLGWVPMAAAAAALLVIGASIALYRQPTAAPVQITSRSTAVSAFAADVSAALFADSAPTAAAASDAPYLHAALDVGSLCTRERYFNGECDDQLSALILEGD